MVASRSRRAAKRPAPKSDGPEDALDEGAAAELVALSTTDSTTLEADATADEASWRLNTGDALTRDAAARREKAVIFMVR